MARILDGINEPQDLRPLTYQEMDQLAQEIREAIITTVSSNGGHLASNLGVVELTIALHRVFDSPKDKLVWDTSNQCYTHKLLTGRRERFASIRKAGGLSGFADPSESPHDTLCAGHAGTGLSIALGIASGAHHLKRDSYVVAIIGDGALTAGLSYEALNNMAHLKPKNFMVILNDNGMSISENIGWLTHWRDRIALHPEYDAVVQKSKDLAHKLPHGDFAWQLVKKVKDSLQGFIIPSMLWEEMGFKYLGPIDGHNIRELEEILKEARQHSHKTPLIHVITHKGKGYPPAEKDPVKYHQPGSPLSSDGSAPTYSRVFADTVIRLMEKDPRVVAISAAMMDGTGLIGVKDRFPDRVYDVGIAEQHAVSMAAGMARGGLKPIVAIYSTFLQRAFDQIVHDVCLQDLPVVLAIDRAGIVGEDGKSHQGAFDISSIRCLPNITMAAPKDENELQHLIYTAVKNDGPMAIRYPRGKGVGIPLDQALRDIPMGKGEVLRYGDDITIVALGSMVYPALEASRILEDENIGCTVVNARFIKPLDETLILEACGHTGRVVTVEEGMLAGGFGSAVLELLNAHDLKDMVVESIGMPDEFIEHGSQSYLRARYDLDSQGIVRRIKANFPELCRDVVPENSIIRTQEAI